MGRWIERRRRHEKRAARFEAMWGWPYSPWFIVWIALFFAPFSFRLLSIWTGLHGTFASPSFSTLPENIAFSRAYDALANLPSPKALANKAAAHGDFRTIHWADIRKEKYKGPVLWFTPWPVRDIAGDDVEDVFYRIIPSAVALCGSDRVSAFYTYEDQPKTAEPGQEHMLSTLPAVCQSIRAFEASAYVLEERGYNGSGPYTSREAAAFFARFRAFLHTYNRALAAHPNATKTLKEEHFWRETYEDQEYELYADALHRIVPESLYRTWISWD